MLLRFFKPYIVIDVTKINRMREACHGVTPATLPAIPSSLSGIMFWVLRINFFE